MARKRTPSGRSRGVTIQSRLIRAVEKSNRSLRRIDKTGKYGKYASKRLLKMTNDPSLKYNRKSKARFKIRNVRSMSTQQQLYYLKKFERYLKAPTSKVTGLEKAETEVKERVKKSLGEIAEKKLTDEDVEDFYDMMNDEDVFGYFTQFIKPSDLYALIDEAKEQNYSQDQFVSMLNIYITINIEETRNKAIKLYEKYVM